MLGVVIGGKSRAGPSWQGESREPRAGAWAAFHAGFGNSRWKERTWGGAGAVELQLESRAVFSEN